MLSKAGEIRRDEYCIDYTGHGSPVTYECHGSKGNQLWLYNHQVRVTFYALQGGSYQICLFLKH